MKPERDDTEIEREIAEVIEEIKKLAIAVSWEFPANSKQMNELQSELDFLGARLKHLRFELWGES